MEIAGKIQKFHQNTRCKFKSKAQVADLNLKFRYLFPFLGMHLKVGILHKIIAVLNEWI